MENLSQPMLVLLLSTKHPSDSNKSDKFSRWWSNWYKYNKCNDIGAIIFGDRVLIRKKFTPRRDKYVQWATLIDISLSSSDLIVGPFDFEPLTSYHQTKRTIAAKIWKQLKDICMDIGILPPTLGASVLHKIR